MANEEKKVSKKSKSQRIKRFDFKKPPVNPKLRWLVRIVVAIGLKRRRSFVLRKHNMEGLEKKPYVLLSNHSSMVDFMVAQRATYPQRLNNVATIEAFHNYTAVLLRSLGVIGKRKFIQDLNLIKNMRYGLHKLGNVFCVYPEARYSLDGCTSYLPDSLGKMMKLLKVPVVVLNIKGNYIDHPQWNKYVKFAPIEADMTQIVTQEEVASLSADEINQRIKTAFEYDDFKWQLDNKIVMDHPKRAEGLNSLLYQCPHCKKEFDMHSEGTQLWCGTCGKRYEMNEYGQLNALEGETEFSHIPDWFKWQRANVREEVRNGTYFIEDEVEIHTMPNSIKYRKQGKGHFVQDCNGMTLTGTAYGEPFVVRKNPLEQESIHIEYPPEFGRDTFDIATHDDSYFFFPLTKRDLPTKVSIATEEIYLMHKERLHEKQAENSEENK